jgi:hypothetical protein
MNADSSPTDGQSVKSRRKLGCGSWIALAVILVVLVGMLLPAVTFWDGRFELLLRPVCQPGIQVESLSYVAVEKRDVAELIAGNPKVDKEPGFLSAERRDDEFVASIRCSGQEKGGIETNYHEPRFLVVRVKCSDDSEVRKVVEIPLGRGKRHVDVPVP